MYRESFEIVEPETGLEYQYEINGAWSGQKNISVCVTGGIIIESNSTCIEKTNVSTVRVKWNEGKKLGTISLTSSEGNASYEVNLITELNGGTISNNLKKQTIDFNKTPFGLSCTLPSGGSCSPQYDYQWQESDNILKWKDIKGKTGANLSFSSPLTETTFFRRKTIDKVSGTIAYSNEAAVYVNAEARGVQ